MTSHTAILAKEFFHLPEAILRYRLSSTASETAWKNISKENAK
jgi:hypothetical protein